MNQQQRRVVLFYSCHPSDDILCDKLVQLLRPLVREGYVEQWSARQILPGIETAQETKRALESATHILLLLSAEYLAEDVCYQEMFSALERQKNGTRVIPIRLRPFLLTKELEASLPSCLPKNGQPVSTWKKREKALDEVAQEICQILGLPLAALHHRSSSDRNRDYLLDQVFDCWIEGFLEPSLQGRMPLDLPWQEQPDALANPDALVNPWSDEVQELKRVLRPLSVEMSIIQAYDDSDGELLILGEPGAGKTTLLLELARMLLKRAERRDEARMPVVFPLSSWAKEKQALGTWLVEELKERYGIPRKIGKRWIDNNAILPLLDGLDEVAESARTACVQAIEAYHTEVQRELVVCCRREEYLALPSRLTLQRAVCIQQATDNQVEQYLRQADQNLDGQLQGLRQGLRGNRELNEFVRTPLMLNIVTIAYQEAQASEVPVGETPKEMQRIIFAQYVKRLFHRRGITTNYTPEQTKHHLTWLARQMVRDNQMGFYIEQMQPDWLPSSGAYRLYRGITTVIFSMLFFAAVGLLVGQLPGLGFGLASGGLIGILNGALNLILRFTWKTWSWLRLLVKCCCFGLVGGLVFALLFRLAVGQFHGQDLGSINGLLFGGIAAVFGLFVDRVLGAPDMNIKPAEVVTWSWKRMRRSLILFLCLGLAGGIIFALFFRYVHSGIAILLLGFYFGLILGMFFGLIRGWSSQEVENESRTTPNQGIWRSARNGLRIGLRAGSVVGLIFGLSIGLIAIIGLAGNPMLLGINIVPDAGLTISGWLEFAILIGLLAMLISGLFTVFVAGLLSGWNAWIKHFVLRFLLSCRGYLPWKLSSFLDYAAERIFLRKVGGGYFFIHRFLRDHFASLETPSSQDVSTVSTSPQKPHEKE